jgi:hypothetical protein
MTDSYSITKIQTHDGKILNHKNTDT